MSINEDDLSPEVVILARKNKANDYADGAKGFLNLFELFKQVVESVDELQDDLDDINMLIEVQFSIPDKDFHWWVKVGEGEYNYGKGKSPSNVEIVTDWKYMKALMTGILVGEELYDEKKMEIIGDLWQGMQYDLFMDNVVKVIHKWQDEHESIYREKDSIYDKMKDE